jgi:hypothetical protein
MAVATYPRDKKTQLMIWLIVAVVVGLLLMGCSTTKTETVKKDVPGAHAKNFEPRTVVDENEVNLMTRIEFQPGSDELTALSKRRISRALAQAETLGSVNEVKVLSWADKEYPSEKRGKLSDEQKSLATRRNQAVRKYIQIIAGGDRMDIYDYNMAKRPSPVAEFFNTSDARVKESMEEAGVATTAHKKAKSRRASTSLVIFNLADSPEVVELNYQTF